ncbi:DNA-binding protein YbiB [Rhodoferax sp.]|uniref:DNA-binding protein YbiB n=1 Tax=Rhodoferax sp. TaxID=50421 RepID=UPI00374C8D51
MGIGNYIKVIGRGRDGARALTREQAADLFGQVLDGTVTDLEIGAFCLAMRIKGETPQEMAGFLDATGARLQPIPSQGRRVVVLPSYNGARKLPVLTPLLALLLARQGLPVVLHGASTETARVSAQNVLLALALPAQAAIKLILPGELQWVPTALLCPGLQRLLDVRRVVGLRNPAHSLVKLLNPCDGPALIVSSYTHAEYASAMTATFQLMQAQALLLRGTEGEPVADPRRTPAMDAIAHGQVTRVQEAQGGTLASVPGLPTPDVQATAHWIQAVLDGDQPVPAPIALQVAHIVRLVDSTRMTA